MDTNALFPIRIECGACWKMLYRDALGVGKRNEKPQLTGKINAVNALYWSTNRGNDPRFICFISPVTIAIQRCSIGKKTTMVETFGGEGTQHDN